MDTLALPWGSKKSMPFVVTTPTRPSTTIIQEVHSDDDAPLLEFTCPPPPEGHTHRGCAFHCGMVVLVFSVVIASLRPVATRVH